MEIPSLPTDNLYKFAALAGIILVVLGIGYPALKFLEIELMANEVTTEYSASTARAEAFKRLSERLADSKATKDQIDRYESLRDKGLEEAALLRGKSDKLILLYKFGQFYVIAGGMVSILGILLTSWGFRRWIVVQGIIDALLIKQLSTHKGPTPARETRNP
ncbi:hypothetical protein [Xanthomonas arboricola]|uniref:hypothetical protein n=1 Tax=Xanthomonas arboricola TaxID=56448 RepID=UPI0011B032B4|nr:hypothetical protein [Xanthomonas arboricola]CAG2088095.1 hypothetical protein XCY_001579 [Xanthomonas arboricola pv. juglandis]